MKRANKFTSYETYSWTSIGLNSLRNSIEKLGFSEILPAPFSALYEPGARHSIVVLGDREVPNIIENDSDNTKDRVVVKGKEYYYVSVSQVVEKQMAAGFLEKVYCIAPCLRLLMEGENTSKKHLFLFFQFEIEWKTQSIDEVFSISEKLLVQFAKDVLERAKDYDINISNTARRNIDSLLKGNYPKITFSEACQLVGRDSSITGDLTPEEDSILSSQFDTAFWIYNYPDNIRDSIYHEEPKGNYQTYDLMLPFGYGELTTGGIRPTTGEEIVNQSKALGTTYNPSYAQWKDASKVQTAGFGIGIERILKFISGSDSILDFVQYHDHGPNKTINSEK